MSSETPVADAEVIYFDRDGDTRLLLDADQEPRIFVVSSKAMTLVCDSWNRMLSPNSHFKEARQGDGREIFLPDDDSDGLEILLNIAHLHFDRVPQELGFEDLLAVSVLTEKYGAIRLVRPWVKRWLEGNKSLIDEPGHEEWLWVAWAFGESEIFEKLSRRLALECSVNQVGKLVTPQDKVLDPESITDYFPPEIIESMMRVREQTLQKLLDGSYALSDAYLDSNTKGENRCKCPVDRSHCDSIVFGSLSLSLQRLGLGPQRRTCTEIHWSIDGLAQKLKTLQIYILGSCYKDGIQYRHSSCSEIGTWTGAGIDKIIQEVPSCILDAQRIHMERNAAELTTEYCARAPRKIRRLRQPYQEEAEEL